MLKAESHWSPHRAAWRSRSPRHGWPPPLLQPGRRHVYHPASRDSLGKMSPRTQQSPEPVLISPRCPVVTRSGAVACRDAAIRVAGLLALTLLASCAEPARLPRTYAPAWTLPPSAYGQPPSYSHPPAAWAPPQPAWVSPAAEPEGMPDPIASQDSAPGSVRTEQNAMNQPPAGGGMGQLPRGGGTFDRPSTAVAAPATRPPPASMNATKSALDFGGAKVGARTPALFEEGGGASTSGFWPGFVSKAFASAAPTAACSQDPVAKDTGAVPSAATADRHSTADFLPGLNDVPWGGTVNGYFIALGCRGR